MVGIVNFGYYLPRSRIKINEIAIAHGKKGQEVTQTLGVSEKTVPDKDEDAVTMAVEAGKKALGKMNPAEIGAVYLGSESHPYNVKPSATIVAEALGIGPDYLAADIQFACKAGTAALQIVAGLLSRGQISYGLVIGSDWARTKRGDALEYTASAGAVALLLGTQPNRIIASIDAFCSFTSDTPDFWRREGEVYPAHLGRFTGEPGYFTHVIGATRKLLDQVGLKPAEIGYVVWHMPNGKYPREAARRLGFSEKQLKPGLIVENIGNPYAASSLLGLVSVLAVAKPKERILLTSYGSGAGSDSFLLTMKNRVLAPGFDAERNRRYLDYGKFRESEQSLGQIP